MKLLKKKSLVVVGLCVLCLCLLAAAVGGNEKDKKNPETNWKQSSDSGVVKVVVTEVKEGPFEDWCSYSADLRGIEDAYLTAPYQGGRVNSVKAVGTRVKAGEALYDIDSSKYEAALQAAKAQVEIARGDMERARANVEKGSIGRSALDAANLVYQNARMALAGAQRAYEESRGEAPFDGILVSRAIERFQTVAPGVQTVRLSKTDRLEAVVSIPETEAFSFTEGMKTRFRLLQNPDRTYDGTLKSIDRAVDTRSRTVAARIELANADGALKPGMVGRAHILRHVYTKAIVVPTTALLRLQNGISAMVVENGVAKKRDIRIGVTSENSAMIAEGLYAKDLLIASGAFQVSDGTRVNY